MYPWIVSPSDFEHNSQFDLKCIPIAHYFSIHKQEPSKSLLTVSIVLSIRSLHKKLTKLTNTNIKLARKVKSL